MDLSSCLIACGDIYLWDRSETDGYPLSDAANDCESAGAKLKGNNFFEIAYTANSLRISMAFHEGSIALYSQTI